MGREVRKTQNLRGIQQPQRFFLQRFRFGLIGLMNEKSESVRKRSKAQSTHAQRLTSK